MDDRVDATKPDSTNEALEFLDAEVSVFSDEGFDVFLVSLALFFEDVASCNFLKEEHAATKRDFEFRMQVFSSRSEEEDELVSVML